MLTAVVNCVLYLVVAGLIFWVLLWIIDFVGLPEPFRKVARVILAVAAAFVVIYALLSLIGAGPGPIARP